MGRHFTTVTATVFTFLFAVTTARISDSPLVHTTCGSNSLPESDSNLVILPIGTTRLNSRSDGADQEKKSETDRLFRVGLTPRSDFARFHAINRRFSDQHRRFRNPHRNEVVLTGKSDARKLHRHGAASRFMKFKHDYGHHHHQQHQHQHQHQHHHIWHNTKDVTMPKRKFVAQKVKSLVHENKEKREHKVSFMKSIICKFLKHTCE